MSESQLADAQPRLRRSLGLVSGVGLIVGITIGSGIYSTPSIISTYFGSFSGVFAAWMGVAVFVLIGGAIYAELGTRMPDTGGEYVYLRKCFGPFVGFMFGWSQLFIIRTSAAAGLAIIATDYVSFFIPLSGTAHTAVALSIIALLGMLNYVGVQYAAVFQNGTTAIKVVGLLVFATIGIVLLTGISSHLGDTVENVRSLSPMGNLVAALMLIVFTHIGWDRLGYVAGEYKNPRKTIPRAMLIGMVVIILIYLLTNVIYHYALGMEAMRATTTPAADVMQLMIGPVGAATVAILAIISAVGSINGTMMSATRVYYAMARDGIFFKSLNFVHPTFRTPTKAIVVHCIWAGVLLVMRGSFEALAAGMVFAILIFYTFTTIALFKLRSAETGDEDVYRMPFYPVLPAIYLIGVVGLLVFRIIYEPEKSMIDFAFIATGLPISWFWLKGRSSDQGLRTGSDFTKNRDKKRDKKEDASAS